MKKLISLVLVALMVLPMIGVSMADEEEVWLPYDPETLEIKMTDRDASGKNGAVASSNWYATKAGLDTLKAGGNAFDAAVAVAYALGVAEPFTSGLGGGGFMTLFEAETGKITVVDYREIAPAAATAEMWLVPGEEEKGTVKTFVDPDGNEFDTTRSYSKESKVGGKAVGTPGEVAGLEYVLENYGTMTRQQVMQPAIDIATNGYVITTTFKSSCEDEYFEVAHMPECAELYLDELGLPFEIGYIKTNPELAKSLQMIADGGKDAFYTGEMAQAMVDVVTKYGGCMTMEDLANYKVEVREPVMGTYKGYTIASVPPASSGGTHLVQILNILENFDLASMEINSAPALHLWSEAFKLAFADRSKYMADTAFKDVPLKGLTSKEYAKVLAAKIDPEKCGTYEADDPYLYQSMSTTSFSVIDQWGNMVACTQTINDFFGSKVVVPGFGFIMNDEMDDFDKKPTATNKVEGGKRPLSSMSPTLVLDPDGKSFATLGSPGATRIFPTCAQVIEHMIDYGMNIQEAINASRIFDNSSNNINYESDGANKITAETIAALEAMGHATTDKGSNALYFGGVQGIQILPDGTLYGGADTRRDGKALAY